MIGERGLAARPTAPGMSEPAPTELSILRSFSPLDGLRSENLRALSRKTSVREMSQGRTLFKDGDTDKRTFYLVSGIVELLAQGKIIATVRANSPDARHALAPILPRRCSARVASKRSSTSRSTATCSTYGSLGTRPAPTKAAICRPTRRPATTG